MHQEHHILFVDKQQTSLNDVVDELRKRFHNRLHLISDEQSLTHKIKNDIPAVIFFDVTFAGKETGFSLLKKLSRNTNHVIIAVLPEHDTALAAKVCELNPFFFIKKPYDTTEIAFTLDRALEKASFIQNSRISNENCRDFCGIIGKTPVMRKLFDLISRVAEDDYATILIRGESGTGKELVAKAIHNRSARSAGKFVAVNCAAIPDELLESELFGHIKGAFTGATQAKQGRIQFAHGGTLFLDEIGDMKPALQAKLLRVLQEKEFEPVGGLQPIPVNTRILAATHCDLEQLVQEGTFREDLYYRLSVIPLHIPPLCERKEDIPLLIRQFITNFTTARGREPFSFSQQALTALLRYTWRGNVRELENLIQHMSILYSGKEVGLDDMPEKYTLSENQSEEDISHLLNDTNAGEQKQEIFANIPGDIILDETHEIDFNAIINDFETKLIIGAMKAASGNKKEAARLLRLKRTTLLEKIKKKKLSANDW